jgi:hypothetical protein
MFCELVASTHVLWVESNQRSGLDGRINKCLKEVEESLDPESKIKIVDIEYFKDEYGFEPLAVMICYQIVENS